MSQSLRTIGAAALGALIVAVAALSVRPGPVAGAPTAGTDIPLHTLTVSANGKVTVVPDVARVYLGVTLTKPTVKEARNAAAKAMTDVIAAIKGLGVADADIQTTGLSLSARYADGSSTKIVGYIISEQVQVTVRDLDKAGDVVDAATTSGATDVNGISFEIARSGQGPGRRSCGGRDRGADQRPGDGLRGARHARCGDLHRGRVRAQPDLLRHGGWRPGGRRQDPRPAGDAGRLGRGDRGLRARLNTGWRATRRRRSGRSFGRSR